MDPSTTADTDQAPPDPAEDCCPAARRLAEIRHRVEHETDRNSPPYTWGAMLRDLLAENDRLAAAAAVQRAEILLEGAELMRRVDRPQAAELLEAQVLLEGVDRGAPASAQQRRDLYAVILAGLAEYQKRIPVQTPVEDFMRDPVGNGFHRDRLAEHLVDTLADAGVSRE